jgi:signal transduction histidine kinase
MARVTDLQRFTAALSSAVGMKDVARVLFEQGLDQFGAKAIGIVWMMRPGQLELVYGHGLTAAEFQELDAAARAGERLPIRDAILSRKPVWLDSPRAIQEQYPVLEPLRARRREHGCAVVPLVIGEWCPGVIGFTFDQPRHFSDADRDFIEVMTHLSAQAFERARLYEAAQEARRAAEHVGRVQEHVMAVVGHDLRTPLGAIGLAAAAMLRDPALPGSRVQTVQRIASSAARMAAIIRDLLDVSRARQGAAMSVVPEWIDLAEIAQQTLAEFPESQEAERVTFTASGDAHAEADPARYSQVVSNLVANAIRHASGTPVTVELLGVEREVVLVVRNRGAPIDPALLPHVFEPFRRGAPAHGEPAGSVGLGLWIVKEIVTAHGGSVEAASDAAAGTAFTVRLPRRRIKRDPPEG